MCFVTRFRLWTVYRKSKKLKLFLSSFGVQRIDKCLGETAFLYMSHLTKYRSERMT